MIKFKIAALFFASTTFGLVIAGIIAIKIYSYQIEQAVASDIYTHASFLEAVENNQLENFIATSCRNLPTSLQTLRNLEEQLFGIDLKEADSGLIVSMEKKLYKQFSPKGICTKFVNQSDIIKVKAIIGNSLESNKL